MLHQSVKPIWKAIKDLLTDVNAVLSYKLIPGSNTKRPPEHLVRCENQYSIYTKSKTVVRLSPDLAIRLAVALEDHANKTKNEFPNNSGNCWNAAESLRGNWHTWYYPNLYGAYVARDQGLPPNTMQIDVVRDGVICRNEPYTQYAFDELIRSIEHAEAQQ